MAPAACWWLAGNCCHGCGTVNALQDRWYDIPGDKRTGYLIEGLTVWSILCFVVGDVLRRGNNRAVSEVSLSEGTAAHPSHGLRMGRVALPHMRSVLGGSTHRKAVR